MPIGLGTAIGYLDLDITGFVNGIDSAMSGLDNLNGNFSTTSKGLNTIGGMFSKTGAALTAGVTAPVAGFAVASVKAGKDFDTSMSQVSAVSKATGEDLEIIRDRALEMGEKTRYSATEVSDAMYYMGLAGWDATQIYKGIPGVLALGAASGEDLSRVSDIVTDSLTAFGKSADDTSEFVNVLAEASRSSNTTVDMLGEAFKYVGPVAGAFGYSIQDTATVLGIFANNGIKSSQAGTGLRQALNSLINPTDKSAAIMDKYGVSLFNADGSTKSLMTVCEELRETFGGLSVDIRNADGELMTGEEIMDKYGHSLPTTEMEKLSDIVKIFGVRALPGMLSVINSADDDFYRLSDAINGAQDSYDGLGTAFGMQETMIDNLQGDWLLFKSALDTTKVLISDMANGALRELLQNFTELVNKFNEMDPVQREQIIKWFLIAASVGPVLAVIGKVISGIGVLINVFKLLKGAFTFVSTGIRHFGEAFSLAKAGFSTFASETNVLGAAIGGLTAPMVIVIAVIAILVAAFVYLWKTNEEFRNKIIGIWEEIKAKFEDAGQRIVEIFNELGFEFEDFEELMEAGIEGLKLAWDGLCQLLAPLFTGAFQLISEVVGGFLNYVVGLFEVIAGVIKGFKDGDWSLLWQGISDIVSGVVEQIGGVLDTLLETIWDMVQTVANWFGADWDTTWEEAKSAVGDWFDSVVQWFEDLPTKMGEFFSGIGQAISDFFGSIGEWFASIPEKIGGVLSTAGETIGEFVESVKQWFSELPGKIGYYIGYALGSVVKWAGEMVAKAREMASDFLQAVIKFFKDLPGNVEQFLTDTISNVSQWVSDMGSKAIEAAGDFTNNLVEGVTELPDKMLEIGSDIVSGIWDGISSGFDWLMEQVGGFVDGVIGGFKDALGIKSPSKVARDQIGKWIPPGIGEGFSNAMPALIKGMQNDINKGISSIDVSDGGDIDITPDVQVVPEEKILDFIDAYKNVFEGLVIWFESMEDRMAVAVESLTEYFKYLMYVRQVLGSDEEFRNFVLYNKNNESNKNTDSGTYTAPIVSGGDVYNFYSPKPIDEIQATRMLKNTKRDLAEGF